MKLAQRFNGLAAISLIGLIALCIAWEMWLAPLRPGGSMLVVKSLPLLLPLFGILRAKRYTHQWTSMLALFYLAEGLVRAYSEHDANRSLALLETTLALLLFIGCVGFSRATRNTALTSP